MPKISIIVPIYNVEKYLRRCLDSIISQTLKDIEIILATDGPENCNKICEEYAQKDNRIIILQNPGSYGKGFNKGLEIASGEYIGIVEADDWCNLEMYEKLYKKAKEYNADVVKCGFFTIYDKEQKIVTFGKSIPENFSIYDNSWFLSWQPSVWSCIYNKKFLIENNIKMIETKQSFIDAPYHYETLYKANKYIIVKEPLYYYYQKNTTQSTKNVNATDGLNSEKYAYSKITQYPKIWNELKEGFLYATVMNLLWNYENIQNKEDLNVFWTKAHNYLNEIDLSGITFYYFKDKYLKEFFEELKNNRHGKFHGRKKEIWVKLFHIVPILKIKNYPNGFKVWLFDTIPLVEFKKSYSSKIKLFNLFYIISWR